MWKRSSVQGRVSHLAVLDKKSRSKIEVLHTSSKLGFEACENYYMRIVTTGWQRHRAKQNQVLEGAPALTPAGAREG